MRSVVRPFPLALLLALHSGCGLQPFADAQRGGRIRSAVLIADPSKSNSAVYRKGIVCNNEGNAAVELLSGPFSGSGTVETLLTADPVEVISAERSFRLVQVTTSGAFVDGRNDYNGHSGPWGADCSGFVAKMWHLPEAMPLEAQKHPFGTVHFIENGKWWNLIERESARIGDAGVIRTDGAGHIVLIESTTT